MSCMDNGWFDELRNTSGFWYVASPYSNFPRGGPHSAFACAANSTAFLAKEGICVFSPIVLTHPLSVFAKLDPLDCDFWLKFDRPFMDAAVGLIVLKLDGWRESEGVRWEIDYFEAADKPVYYMEEVE